MAEAAFGAQLRQCRQAVGLSLRQLAGRVGYDHSYLSQVERGQRPGSADLARLCDRELGTESRLTAAFEQGRSTAGRLQPAESPVAADPLQAAWHELVQSFGIVDPAAELEDFRSVPPGRLLPELIMDLRALPASMPTQVARLTALIALTLTGLGQVHAARRWWHTARTTADRSAEPPVRSSVRALEAASGLAERRPLPQLLELTEEALALGRQSPGCLLQAHAARAQVLAELGRGAEAHRALQELLSVADVLPVASTTNDWLTDWASYQVRWAEGRICARLGYGGAGCVLLGRALEECPETWLGERAGVELGLAECLAVDGEVAASVALALRVLVELPDEWHTYYLYDAAERVLNVVRAQEPGLTAAWDLQEVLRRQVYLGGRRVGTGSSALQWQG
ncbi:helix-turn-helix domain-containing protein [Kribbella sp. NPDC050124]|uniref:helix-turn-helix domain-containing protein n=1 Tax=Kribbella sp. NPDC050124 TaxID=3364114 RepID=UPI0037AD3824